ncbi:MAG: hypothetical protein M0Z67_02640 [Nitrospiraceae bacterium]|nr:hypothetical protein [Nitrospiraceae bacterium]
MVEIYYDDLNEEGRKKVLDEFGVESPGDMNWDIVPVFVLEYEEKDKDDLDKGHCACGSDIDVQSTYCGSFCPECLKEHVRGCDICRKDFA